MASVVPQKACPTDGRYPFTVTAATPGFTKVKEVAGQQRGGDSKISLELEVAEGEFTGYPAFDELGTDGGTNFGAASKKRLRQLDIPGLDSDAEIPDDVIAASLLNRRVWAEVKREQRENAQGEKQFDIDEKTQMKTPLYRLRIVGYLRQQTGQQAQAPQGQLAPPPQGGVPQGYPQQGAPQGYPQAPGAPQGWPQAPGMVPGGYAPPAPGAVPGGYAPQAAPGFPQVAPPPGWGVPQNGAPQSAPQAPGQQGFQYPGAPGLPGAPR